MGKHLKLLSILFVFSLLALPLTGCENPPWDSGSLLVLKVDTPKDGTAVTTSMVTVSGRVVGSESKGAKVSINNVDAPVTDGKYSANVTLTEGKNVINIVGTSGQAKPFENVTVTYVPAKQ
jgi:nitrogen fixation protein FixH